MFAKFINIYKEEPFYKFCEDDNINGCMRLMIKNKIEFPQTSDGFSKLIEIYAKDRANNVSDENKLKHICHFMRVAFPILGTSIDNKSSTETSAKGDGYETALETLNDNPLQPSEEIDDVNATPKAGTPIAPHEDGPVDPFDEPVSLCNEEIETIQAHLAAHSEAKKSDNFCARKKTHADVSVSPNSGENTQNDSDVSVLSLGQVVDSMSLEQDGGRGLITPVFQKPVEPPISNTSRNRIRRSVPLPRRVLLNVPSTVAQPLACEPKPVVTPTIQKSSSEISNGSGIAPVMNGNVSTPKSVAATNEIHKTPSGPGIAPPMSGNTSVASSSSTRRTRFTGPAADEKLRQREEAEKQLQKV
uniref:Uncharacterized protein n=1 Tax=Panagrolaimus sp. PS1159 TaxID=55785 RepID=A0AC35FJW5_9BILA